MNPTASPLAIPGRTKGESLWRDAFQRLTRNRLAMSGAILLGILVVLAILTPLIAPYEYDAQDRSLGASPPSAEHWMGTDILGRDLLTRILYGGRISLMVGFTATGVSLIIGVLYGSIAGFLGGKADSLLMRLVDILYSLPFPVVVIILMVYIPTNQPLWGGIVIPRYVLLFLAIGMVEWLTMARIVRGQVLSIKEREFIEAARAIGMRKRRILLRHLIPNALGPIIVYATLTIPQIMLLEAFLSFLGLGVQAPMSSWGLLISAGVESMEEYPWLLIFPSLALSMTLFSLNFLGDGLRDALDPRSSRD
ncbi:MAG: ABC transporter permease [Candidatus Sumerlaeia bacterium]